MVAQTAEQADGSEPGGSERRRLSKNEARRLREALQELEEEIGQVEYTLEQLGEALQAATASEDVGKIQSLSIEYAATEERLETLMNQWEELAHEQTVAG